MPEERLPQRGRRRVVLDADFATEALRELAGDGDPLEPGDVREAIAAPARVALTWDGDAHRIRARGEPLDDGGDGVEHHGRRPVGLGGLRPDDLAALGRARP